ncbi:MAG: hypothetical protein R3E89_09210 [Thiolinea sp.]
MQPEVSRLTDELLALAKEKSIRLMEGEQLLDDVLTYTLFPQVGLKFPQNRDNPSAFEPVPTGKESTVPMTDAGEEIYTVTVEGVQYTVTVNNGGDITGLVPVQAGGSTPSASATAAGGGTPFPPLWPVISSRCWLNPARKWKRARP